MRAAEEEGAVGILFLTDADVVESSLVLEDAEEAAGTLSLSRDCSMLGPVCSLGCCPCLCMLRGSYAPMVMVLEEASAEEEASLEGGWESCASSLCRTLVAEEDDEDEEERPLLVLLEVVLDAAAVG